MFSEPVKQILYLNKQTPLSFLFHHLLHSNLFPNCGAHKQVKGKKKQKIHLPSLVCMVAQVRRSMFGFADTFFKCFKINQNSNIPFQNVFYRRFKHHVYFVRIALFCSPSYYWVTSLKIVKEMKTGRAVKIQKKCLEQNSLFI